MQKSNSIDDQSLRELIIGWMCTIGYDDCQRQSDDLFKAWMQSSNPDEDNPIDPGVRGTVYCTAIEDGDEKEWNFLWQRLKRTSKYKFALNFRTEIGIKSSVKMVDHSY